MLKSYSAMSIMRMTSIQPIRKNHNDNAQVDSIPEIPHLRQSRSHTQVSSGRRRLTKPPKTTATIETKSSFNDYPMFNALSDRKRNSIRHKGGLPGTGNFCACHICQGNDAGKYRGFEQKTYVPEKPKRAILADYTETWAQFIRTLAEINKDVQIAIPETVFFKMGKPEFIVQTLPKTGRLSITLNPSKMKFGNINKSFTEVSKLRKAEGIEAYTGKEIALMRYTVGDVEVVDGLRARDENGPLRVMHEADLFEMLTYRSPGSSAWKPVLYLQSILKARLGMGEIIEIDYTSEIHDGIEAIQRIINASIHLTDYQDSYLQLQNPTEY